MLEQKLTILDKRIGRRDKREIILAACSILVLSASMNWIPGVQAKIGAGIIAWGCLFVIYKLWMAGKTERGPTTDLQQHFIAAKFKIERQVKLLDTVVFWYLLPAYCGVVVFFTGLPIASMAKVLLVSGVAGLYAFIHQANKKAVKDELLPMKENIERALDEYKDENRAQIRENLPSQL